MSLLSLRLESALKYTKGFYKLADIGCDHAYFPIEAIMLGYVKKAIASDNKQRPYEHAMINVIEHNLEAQIQVVLTDGLDCLDDEVDIVSILGMGGFMIRDILETKDVAKIKRFVFSPNSDQHVVREFLEENNFNIIDEEFIKDKGKFYQIIVCEHGIMHLTSNERKYGPINIKKQPSALIEFIQLMVSKLEVALLHSKTEDSKQKLQNELAELKEVLM